MAMSPSIATTAPGASPAWRANVSQRVRSRTRTARRRGAPYVVQRFTTAAPSRPVAPVTSTTPSPCAAWKSRMSTSDLHGECRPVRAISIGEEQRALTRAHVALVDGVAQVDEVVAGERMAPARDVASPEACVGKAREAQQHVPAPRAHVVRDHPVHVFPAPTRAAQRTLDR